MRSNSLVSIIMLSYKNMKYMNECLDSIFAQTYENIELIISNDGNPEFDERGVGDYVNRKKRANIKNVVIHKNEYNLGTVRHCNVALDLANGEYLMFIACDDIYSNDNAVKNMVDGFKIVPPDVMSIVSQTAMYDENLEECFYLYVDEEEKKLINELTSYELYKRVVFLKGLPQASRIFKREVFERYGRFDERYFLVEDLSSSISQCKQGMKNYYLDIMCVNHRDGGVSTPNSNMYKMYLKDIIAINEEILKDEEELSEDSMKWVKYRLSFYKAILQNPKLYTTQYLELIYKRQRNREIHGNEFASKYVESKIVLKDLIRTYEEILKEKESFSEYFVKIIEDTLVNYKFLARHPQFDIAKLRGIDRA